MTKKKKIIIFAIAIVSVIAIALTIYFATRCSRCSGVGYVVCDYSHCYIGRDTQCKSCDGTGLKKDINTNNWSYYYEECSRCNGTGIILSSTKICERCGGDTTMPCPKCK